MSGPSPFGRHPKPNLILLLFLLLLLLLPLLLLLLLIIVIILILILILIRHDEAVKVAPVIAPTVALVRRPPGPGKGWGKGSR